MAILRIKDGDEWEEIEAIKGDQGVQGPPGPDGPPGADYEITQEDYQEIANVVESDIQPTLDSKVDKIAGKGLSTNDFSDSYKTDVNNNTNARHGHSNKSVLDGINSSKVANWDNKAEVSSIPTRVSQLSNDNGYITKYANNLINYTLRDSTGSYIDLEINQSTYVVTLKLKNKDGNVISTDTIDLPLESVVVGGSYDSTNKKIVLTLENGNTVDIPVGDLVAGLQTEITSQNKLDSDLVDDTNSGNKFVTTSEKQTWNNKIDSSALTDYVKNTDYGTTSDGGVVKYGNYGFKINSSGVGYIQKATNVNIDAKTSDYNCIVPSNLDYAVKTGVTTNTITLSDTEKTNARNWLGAVGFNDYGTTTDAGVVKAGNYGFRISNMGVGYVLRASEGNIDTKSSEYLPIVPSKLDYATKVGVTTNTIALSDSEKEKAQKWLGIDEIVADAKGTNLELTDSKAKKVENITLYGKSSQTKNTGSNLLQMTDSNYFFANNTIIKFDTTCFLENNGATISFPDGSGTISVNSRFLVYDLSTICNLQVGSWYSITVEGGQYAGLGVNLAEYPENPADIYARTKTITGGRNFSWTWKVEADKKYMIEFRSPTNGEGASMWKDNPFKINVMVNAGKPKSFEAYTNKVATPSIASPSTITDITSESVEITDGTNTQTATLNLTAGGIPVKSGGNYTDENGQEWICDTIDKATGKYIQRVYRQTLPNSFSKSNTSGNFLLTVSYLDYAPKLPSSQYAISYDVMCNQFKNDTTWISQNGYVVVDGTKVSFATAQEFNEYFTEHPLIYEYILDTPIETDLTEEQLQQLDLATYNGETSITSNIALDISYIADAKKYVDENIESSLKERDKWSLITEYYVNEPITTPIDWSSDTEMYDDILVVAENLLGGETQSAFAVSCKLSNSNDYFAINQSNILQPSTVRTAIVEVTRYLPSKWRFEKKGTYASTILGDVSSTAIPNDTQYEHKIKAVKVYTASGSNFTTGTIKVYGRKRF